MVQNLMLATQALGTGGHPFSGRRVPPRRGALARDRRRGPCGSLGFAFHRVPTTRRSAADRPGRAARSSRARAPPFTRTWMRPSTSWSPVVSATTASSAPTAIGPWKSADVARAVPPPSEEAIAATKTLCSYIWDTYGRFPATIDPFVMTVWYQACHLDVDFYDRYYPAEALRARPLAHARLARRVGPAGDGRAWAASTTRQQGPARGASSSGISLLESGTRSRAPGFSTRPTAS